MLAADTAAVPHRTEGPRAHHRAIADARRAEAAARLHLRAVERTLAAIERRLDAALADTRRQLTLPLVPAPPLSWRVELPAPAPPRRHLPIVQAPPSAAPPDWMHALARRGRLGDPVRPRRRADCAGVPRPCPFVGCRYHLWHRQITPRGIIRHQDTPPWELRHSCALDIADAQLLQSREAMAAEGLISSPHIKPGAGALEAIARLTGVTKPTVHEQLQLAIEAMRRAMPD